LHCIVAPQITNDAIEYIKGRKKWGKNLNIFQYINNRKMSILSHLGNIDIRSIPGAMLIQERDFYTCEITYEIVSGEVNAQTIDDLLFAFKVAKFVKSNAIVIVRNKKTCGIGSGQTSRIEAVKNAISKMKEIPPGCCLASDSFFPFTDSLEYASKCGIKNFITPKGSVNDEEIIKYAKENNLTLLFTNVRHFKH
ncbi:MAG: bifunctional phosphoribosylaminoimidazolecarboxamide formyltransferase/IMP cyclohydrolase, partial [Planctomycetota bacterium]